jgi:hypothetical protein
MGFSVWAVLLTNSEPSATLISRYVSIISKGEMMSVYRQPLSIPLRSLFLIATWQEDLSL